MSTPLRQLIDDRLGEDVTAWVAIRRAGTSWRVLAREVSAATGITVTHETLRSWVAEAATADVA